MPKTKNKATNKKLEHNVHLEEKSKPSPKQSDEESSIDKKEESEDEETEEKEELKRKKKVPESAKKPFAAKYFNIDKTYDDKKVEEIRKEMLESTKKGPNYKPLFTEKEYEALFEQQKEALEEIRKKSGFYEGAFPAKLPGATYYRMY